MVVRLPQREGPQERGTEATVFCVLTVEVTCPYSATQTHPASLSSDPCCRRPPRGDLRPAEPQAPHPEGSQSCVPTVRRAPGRVQHVCNHCQTLTPCPPGLCPKYAGSHTCKSPKWTLGWFPCGMIPFWKDIQSILLQATAGVLRPHITS